MGHNNRITFAIAQLQGRLHTAVGDKRCGCGLCGYWVARAARSAGTSRQTLEAHLAPAAKPRRHRRASRPLTSRICDSSTIRARGSEDLGEGIALLLSRLHQDG
ncbi:hypothetical protein A5746_12995 [Mycolicibacterium conceptionense]|uniref:hypothetical protein n=1 Tax=Mycolicibacterium conceptionense TaxID=451644 RepID=UPI0007EC8277|nr:hypothetical protein [Mycolicibacterium conceptionense]OBJ98307.1 hypothetical protein A5639_29455 [Mycolicibacterium conceptionense]OMB72702.1 hypothetical protein A5741_05660 [Mycolicibacterium conceptionense]OMB99994.1 hypothetical protein A5746_12995 [Mycolicibacterium conceptionense]